MTYAIKIVDDKGKLIGELMTATPNDILKFINKGLHVINQATNTEITAQEITSVIGVSDGVIN